MTLFSTGTSYVLLVPVVIDCCLVGASGNPLKLHSLSVNATYYLGIRKNRTLRQQKNVIFIGTSYLLLVHFALYC